MRPEVRRRNEACRRHAPSSAGERFPHGHRHRRSTAASRAGHPRTSWRRSSASDRHDRHSISLRASGAFPRATRSRARRTHRGSRRDVDFRRPPAIGRVPLPGATGTLAGVMMTAEEARTPPPSCAASTPTLRLSLTLSPPTTGQLTDSPPTTTHGPASTPGTRAGGTRRRRPGKPTPARRSRPASASLGWPGLSRRRRGLRGNLRTLRTLRRTRTMATSGPGRREDADLIAFGRLTS